MLAVQVPAVAPQDISANSTDPATTHPFTCNSCQVAFRNSELQRSHMRTDWHRYNLKRRVASLPPIGAETFTTKVLTAQESSRAIAAKASFEKVCTTCQRTYYSENAYMNHVKSRNHQLRVAAIAGEMSTQDGDGESIISSTLSLGEPIPVSAQPKAISLVTDGLRKTSISGTVTTPSVETPNASGQESSTNPLQSPDQNVAEQQQSEQDLSARSCLFCSSIAPDRAAGELHMQKVHGLFIPEEKYLIDREGLFDWLFRRVNDDHECLYCHKLRNSAEATRAHMRDLGHCRIAFEDESDMIQVGQFYDFSSTYSDPELDDDDAMVDVASDLHEDKILDQEDWESDNDVPSDSADDYIDIERKVPHGSDRRKDRGLESSENAQVIENELHLPSGKVAGHRSLARYFRQNLPDHPIVEAEDLIVEEGDDNDDDSDETETETNDDHNIDVNSSSLAAHRPAPSHVPQNRAPPRHQTRQQQQLIRSRGGMGMLGVSADKRREVAASEKRELKRAQRAQNQYQWALDKRGNSQKHFRDPLLQ